MLDRIKPDAPIKSKINLAQSQLDTQITKLESIHQRLQQRNDMIFSKIVDAQKSNNVACAQAYAIELQEIRKMGNMVKNTKLSMEQIQHRLNTISDLGDVVVTLSPCMSVIKGLNTSIGGLVPDANASMQDLSKMLEDVLSSSAVAGRDMSIGENANAETMAILEEAHDVMAGKTKDSLPDLPDNLKDDIMKRRKVYT